MSEHECICIAGGSMFYRHMHESHCPLSVHGEEAPKSKEQVEIDGKLKARVERLEEALRAVRPNVCSYLCPGVKIGSGWDHDEKCLRIKQALADEPGAGEEPK